MRTSQDGISLIQGFEGCRLTSYQDGGGVWTIGYGRTAGVCAGMTITMDEANDFLVEDLVQTENFVNVYVTVPLSQHQFDALVSFTYNLGSGSLKRSTLLRLLNLGQYQNAADELLKWDHDNGVRVPGLTRRRNTERDLFLTPDATSFMSKIKKWLLG